MTTKTDKGKSLHTRRSLLLMFRSLIWRDLWRNPRRTIITTASIFFAVFFCTLMQSYQYGTYDAMIQQSIGAYTGYFQIQHPEYKEDACLENNFSCSQGLLERIGKIANINGVAPRIESFALASSGMLSKGVLLSGISPKYEKGMSNPERYLVKHRFSEQVLEKIAEDNSISEDIYKKCQTIGQSSYTSLKTLVDELELSEKDSIIIKKISELTAIFSEPLTETDDGILISNRLARYLKVNIGDTVVLMGQGYQGANAAGVFPIKGIVRMPSPDLDNKMIYMTLHTVNAFLGLSGEEATSVAINLINPDEIESTRKLIEKELDAESMALLDWEELNPELRQQIDSDKIFTFFLIGVLYLIVFFGIFGTITMMIAERTREFGMMISIGMKRKWLAMTFCVEMFLLGVIGLIIGLLVTVPLILIGHYYPIRVTGSLAYAMIEMGLEPVLPLALFDTYFYMQAVVVSFMLIIACIYPIRKLLKLDELKALKS